MRNNSEQASNSRDRYHIENECSLNTNNRSIFAWSSLGMHVIRRMIQLAEL
jgi:hypothetical protein